MTVERVGKVTAVVLRAGSQGSEVLVFDHPLDEGGFMIQLPAGTIEPGEAPEHAVIRELQEEAEVHGQITALAGVLDEQRNGEHRRRWIYLLRSTHETRNEWPSTCDCGMPTRCYWLPFEQATIVAPQQVWLDAARDWVHRQERERNP